MYAHHILDVHSGHCVYTMLVLVYHRYPAEHCLTSLLRLRGVSHPPLTPRGSLPKRVISFQPRIIVNYFRRSIDMQTSVSLRKRSRVRLYAHAFGAIARKRCSEMRVPEGALCATTTERDLCAFSRRH